jgi:creatinine amidohydrolase
LPNPTEVRSLVSAIVDFYLYREPVIPEIPEARHLPGTISIDGELILRLLDNLCREIARNGLKKIVFVNAHGGNQNLLQFFNELQLARPHDYVVYLIHLFNLRGTAIEVPWDRANDLHAGADETSLIRAIHPDLVHMERVPADGEGRPRQRLKALQDAGVRTGIWWYADYPTHYAGDAQPATAELGEQMLSAMAEGLAQAIRAVKEDDVTPHLQDAFYAASEAPGTE